jgi:acetyltransferase
MSDPDFSEFGALLRDGRAVHVRAIRVADEGEILQAFGPMSADARYMRFMRSVREPDVGRLRQVLAMFPAAGIGIVATVPAADGIDIVGSATCFISRHDPATCEFAISVAEAFGGVGLASTLMRALIDAAGKRGLQQMEGFVLAANRPMLRLAQRLGFSVARDKDDPSVCVCRLPLRPAWRAAAAWVIGMRPVPRPEPPARYFGLLAWPSLTPFS